MHIAQSKIWLNVHPLQNPVLQILWKSYVMVLILNGHLLYGVIAVISGF